MVLISKSYRKIESYLQQNHVTEEIREINFTSCFPYLCFPKKVKGNTKLLACGLNGKKITHGLESVGNATTEKLLFKNQKYTDRETCFSAPGEV